MFDTTKAFSGFSVDDVYAAKEFYGQTLGLPVIEMDMAGYVLLTLKLGEGREILVYPKPDHTPATFTILNFPVDDIDATVDELTRRGVEFLRYDVFDQDDKGVERSGEGPLIAWFADPAGNVLSVLQEE
ncbi:VOC family protein [Actinobacteria bacterium YIM 96077]|uniref:VOC family protein n=1 Tax=Phytoactinopolyspora halophila TaxID=1981511 RepID=A0A329QQT0_9ACTN|nr:VOC family protein [Phytoactinopolyspora halophila]AYY14573.1 VOC family protein [Actinobacteria bacterium YIM 96077]RAW14049.1 VOC family protein [Phytoactinopolyspora halophila]